MAETGIFFIFGFGKFLKGGEVNTALLAPLQFAAKLSDTFNFVRGFWQEI